MAVEQFVCAFRGARDRYQAPWALAESGQLDRFITDAYATPAMRAVLPWLPASVRATIASRSCDGIPPDKVACLWLSTVQEHARHRLGYSPKVTWLKHDRHFSEAAAARARRTRASLFLYSPYAWEAFTARYAHTPRRILFQYHPHPELEARILSDDARRFPGYGESFSDGRAEMVPDTLLAREANSWRHADLVVCASAFTRRSLVEAGCAPELCRVIPYGIDVRPTPARPLGRDGYRVLFVGSGGQRKGLHHLLLAWRMARLPADATLTLVCRVIDRGIEALARSLPNVRVVREASPSALLDLYASHTLFAMPSLVEGFGQVYLEALAEGCPVLGTAHSALPDLGGESDGIYLAPPSDVDALSDQLEQLASLVGNDAIRRAARRTALRFAWPAFRAGLRSAIQ